MVSGPGGGDSPPARDSCRFTNKARAVLATLRREAMTAGDGMTAAAVDSILGVDAGGNTVPATVRDRGRAAWVLAGAEWTEGSAVPEAVRTLAGDGVEGVPVLAPKPTRPRRAGGDAGGAECG